MPSVARGGSGRFGFIIKSGGETFVASVGRFADDVDNLRPVLDRVVRQNVMNAMDRVFREEGKFTRGGRWEALSNNAWADDKRGGDIRPGYLDWKTGKFADRPGTWWAFRGPFGVYFPKILTLTDAFMSSLTTKGRGSVWASRARQFIFGSRYRTKKGFDLPRAHAMGTKRMPARPFLDWDVTGAGRQLWIRAIFKPVGFFIRGGLDHVEKHGYIDVDDVEFIPDSGPLIEGRAGGRGA
ncbi:MAG: hypothetical protein B7733_07090 [Myxococcales bacterium FL481]|nr:MAG: hypothetical protein B7733_07090 [Myxococcales bacterium FL481]